MANQLIQLVASPAITHPFTINMSMGSNILDKKSNSPYGTVWCQS
jgi:hypothetical protein